MVNTWFHAIEYLLPCPLPGSNIKNLTAKTNAPWMIHDSNKYSKPGALPEACHWLLTYTYFVWILSSNPMGLQSTYPWKRSPYRGTPIGDWFFKPFQHLSSILIFGYNVLYPLVVGKKVRKESSIKATKDPFRIPQLSGLAFEQKSEWLETNFSVIESKSHSKQGILHMLAWTSLSPTYFIVGPSWMLFPQCAFTTATKDRSSDAEALPSIQ